MKTELCNILEKAGSDKSVYHNYTPFYTLLFEKKRYEKNNIFEMGLGYRKGHLFAHKQYTAGYYGDSLRAWREYFPNSQIYGADINPKAIEAINEEKIKVFLCDQTDSTTVKNMWENETFKDLEFDIIIDDGRHDFAANHCFLVNSIHKLKKDGIYIIEDMFDGNVRQFLNILQDIKKQYDLNTIEINRTTKYDDRNKCYVSNNNFVYIIK